MRIGLVSISYAPEPTGIAPYSADLAQALAARGHDVRVVTTFPYYPAWKPQLPWFGVLRRKERLGRITVLRYRCYVPVRPNGIRRALHDLSFAAVSSAAVLSLTRWANVTVFVSPSFGSALQGALLSRLGRRRLHLHVQDLVTDLAVEVGLVDRGARVLGPVGNAVYRAYPSISVLNEEMASALHAHGVPPERITVVPNWVRRFPAVGGGLGVHAGDGPYVLFAGSFGRKQGLSALTKLAARLEQEKGPRVLVLGDGVGREQLTSTMSPWLRWAGLLGEEEYDSCLRSALAGVVSLVSGVGRSVVPSKVVSYMAASLPVVVMADLGSPVSRLVGSVGCGMVVPAGDAAAAATAIQELAQRPAEAREMGERGFRFAAEHWSRETVVSKLEECLLRLGRNVSSS